MTSSPSDRFIAKIETNAPMVDPSSMTPTLNRSYTSSKKTTPNYVATLFKTCSRFRRSISTPHTLNNWIRISQGKRNTTDPIAAGKTRLHSSPIYAPLIFLSTIALTLSACGATANSQNTTSTGGSTTTTPSANSKASTVSISLSASEPSWQLRAPLSRMVLLPAGSEGLTILGGLTALDTSANGVFSLNLANGTLTPFATLPAPVHDAAGALIAGNYVVIGGGSVNSVSTVEAVPSTGGNGSVIGNLPQARSDCTAVTIGKTTVVVGGYNGTSADPTVLATTNGSSYKTIASLKVPVRYAALAALGNYVYVFGGLAAEGSNIGQPVSTIEKINLSSGSASIVGSLPEPLEGAAAFVLNGRIYLAGGDTSTPGGNGSTANLVSNTTVWAFQRESGFRAVATLPLGVSNAGVAVTGGAAWIVGGEHDGKTTAIVQKLTPR